MKKYLRVWRQMIVCSGGVYLSSRLDSGAFVLGKIGRFAGFLLLIYTIFLHTDTLAGYDKYEVLVFFVTFNIIDTLAQIFFRSIYFFKNDVINGNFDFSLTKPVHALFYNLFRLTDFLDIIFFILLVAVFVTILNFSNIPLNFLTIMLYLGSLFLGFIVIVSFYILSMCVTVWTLESENIIWLYRGISQLGGFPPEIFSPTVQFVFTYVFPILVAISFPAKAILGIFSLKMLAVSVIMAAAFFSVSVWLWKKSLIHYSSASS